MSDIVERWTLGGYGPGNYRCTCSTCKSEFTGDKRATQCLPCAGKEAAAEIVRLRAEVQTWVNHTKTAVWSDSEECKMLSSEVERLLKSRNRWAKKYNDLLEKRRAEDGYDVYAAAREEYRKKIAKQAAEIERLRAALREIVDCHLYSTRPWAIARAALGEKP